MKKTMDFVRGMNKSRGFTLIELLIVIIIIGILATIAVVSYGGSSARAKKSAFVQGMNDAITAAAMCVANGDSLAVYTSFTGGASPASGNPVCVPTTGTPTSVVMSGAGDSSYNGTYTQNGTYGGVFAYSLPNSSRWISWTRESAMMPYAWYAGVNVPGSTAGYVGTGNSLPANSWSTVGGGGTSPVVALGGSGTAWPSSTQANGYAPTLSTASGAVVISGMTTNPTPTATCTASHCY